MRHINIYIYIYIFNSRQNFIYNSYLAWELLILWTISFIFSTDEDKFDKPSWIIIFKIYAQKHIRNNVPIKGKLIYLLKKKNISTVSLFVALSSVVKNILSIIPQYWSSSSIRFAMLNNVCGDSKI